VADGTQDVAPASLLSHPDRFGSRHLGPRPDEIAAMLQALGCASLSALIDDAVPQSLRTPRPLTLPPPLTETEVLVDLRALADDNQVLRSYLGLGYHAAVIPPVIQRNILENPGWYTQYTPYQPEISQGRLEALLNFQTLVADLTGMDIANSSMLDEATAAAEAMTLCKRGLGRKNKATVFFVADHCHPQTVAVVQTRAEPLGYTVVVGPVSDCPTEGLFGALVQVPDTSGAIGDLRGFVDRVHDQGALVVVATDLFALTLMEAPGTWGADVVVGNSQRFGVPLGFGGPHAAFMATRDAYRRQLPGRIIGVSKDAHGRPALRLALQTREQHIRRDKATSNICTAQVLLAVMASMYAVYHGPDGLTAIARRIHAFTRALAEVLASAGHQVLHQRFFDTLRVRPGSGDPLAAALALGINLRDFGDGTVGIALDETVDPQDLDDLAAAFGCGPADWADVLSGLDLSLGDLDRTAPFMGHPIFHSHRSETELLRYIKRLEAKDLSLTTSMIPLGSCTMKLNAAAEMVPVSWAGFGGIHPFAPADQTRGYRELFDRLERWLCEITGFDGCSLQPNAGSQGEYAGLLTIRAWQQGRGQGHRDVCLIPMSAHGTNPASAVMAGMRVVVVKCDGDGNVDLDDLGAKAARHSDDLAALMITYPSTHGVFEETIHDVCRLVHEHGGQVYLDGANMNAMVGLARPAEFGADVCHLNLHKTFCIPHGGGGPGMGPICVAAHLAPHLPGHPLVDLGHARASGCISAAPWGSPSILPISYAYIAMMGAADLTLASELAILNANYIATRLSEHYPVLYKGKTGRVAHECIIDLRPLKASSGISVDDVAKRLMDFGFHAPTMSFPVAGTLMIEPTESECQAELDRLCDALATIREEIRAVEDGLLSAGDSPLRHAPHTAAEVTADAWQRGYARSQAAWPAPWTRQHKFWPPVSRVDNAWGDRNLVCECPPLDAYEA